MLNNLELKSGHFLIKPKEKTKGGIFIPENADAIVDSIMNEPQLVIHTAKDLKWINSGDYIQIEAHQLRPIKIDGEHYFIVPEFRVDTKVLNYSPKLEEPNTPKSPIILNS